MLQYWLKLIVAKANYQVVVSGYTQVTTLRANILRTLFSYSLHLIIVPKSHPYNNTVLFSWSKTKISEKLQKIYLICSNPRLQPSFCLITKHDQQIRFAFPKANFHITCPAKKIPCIYISWFTYETIISYMKNVVIKPPAATYTTHPSHITSHWRE